MNPAYRSGNYMPFPTPIPGGKLNGQAVDVGESDPEDSGTNGRQTIAVGRSTSIPNGRGASSTPALLDAQDAGESFEGNTFQQAQEKIVTELMQLKDDE